MTVRSRLARMGRFREMHHSREWLQTVRRGVGCSKELLRECCGFSRGLAQRGGSIEDQPFGAGIIVVAEIALALELQGLAVGIGGGCALDEAAAERMHGMWVEVGRE